MPAVGSGRAGGAGRGVVDGCGGVAEENGDGLKLGAAAVAGGPETEGGAGWGATGMAGPAGGDRCPSQITSQDASTAPMAIIQ